MYSIISKDRRVTNYVKAQCYKWLFAKVVNNEYDAHSSEAENVILQIKKVGEVDETSYNEFCKYFINDPYYFILNNDRDKKMRGISTNHLANYFVRYNDNILPVGFIRDFFEDDYETRADIEEFYKTYLDGTLDDFIVNCQMAKNMRYENIETIKNNNECVFNTKVMFHVTNAIKFVLTIVGLILSLSYIIGNDTVINLIDHLKNGGNVFIQNNLFTVIANFIFLLYLLPHVKKCIRLIIFYVKLIKMNIYVKSLVAAIDDFNTDTMENFKVHFGNINNVLKNSQYIDEVCFTAPAGKKKYLAIMDFDASVVYDKLQKLVDKYYKTGFAYNDEDSLDRQKRIWRRGIIFFVLVIIVFFILNIPVFNEAFTDLVNYLVDLFESI